MKTVFYCVWPSSKLPRAGFNDIIFDDRGQYFSDDAAEISYLRTCALLNKDIQEVTM